MSAPLSRAAYAELLGTARRHCRRADEAEDLLHDALLAAIASGRGTSADSRRWLSGVIRNLARMQARSAARRRRREAAAGPLGDSAAPAQPADAPVIPADLPRALRAVLALSLAGHSRAEIRYLLRISDEALRQRIAGLRRRAASFGSAPAEPLLAGLLAHGRLRRSLLPAARLLDLPVTHDPDGHPIALGIFPRRAHERRTGGN